MGYVQTLEPIIDYFSFTISTKQALRSFSQIIMEGHVHALENRELEIYKLLSSLGTPKVYGGKGRFDTMFRWEDEGISYLEGEKCSVSLIQISGSGCAVLREWGTLNDVIRDWTDRATRLDIAVDIETDTLPEPFARSRSSQRFKNGGHIRGARGETWYVGGKQSDRHARVYRYDPPSPRSDFLRVEYELHDDEAKQASSRCMELGVHAVACELGVTFGWTHEDYRLASDVEKIKSVSRPASFNRTEWWVESAVKPALEKLAKSGRLQFLIAFESWLRAMILKYSINTEE